MKGSRRWDSSKRPAPVSNKACGRNICRTEWATGSRLDVHDAGIYRQPDDNKKLMVEAGNVLTIEFPASIFNKMKKRRRALTAASAFASKTMCSSRARVTTCSQRIAQKQFTKLNRSKDAFLMTASLDTADPRLESHWKVFSSAEIPKASDSDSVLIIGYPDDEGISLNNGRKEPRKALPPF